MICCYILFSKTMNCNYIGICHDDLVERIRKHNTHEYGEHRFTAKATDWTLILTIECVTISQARKIELHIKKMKSATYITNLCRYPEMVEKLKVRYAG